MEIRPASRKQVKLKMNLSGPSGSGKTYSGLLLASGIASSWEKVCLIDTENGRGDLYSHLGPYKVIRIEPPFTPEKYIEAIVTAEDAGIEVIIIDSMSHEWDGLGGILQMQVPIAEKKFRGNTWAAWSKLTPRHQQLMYSIINSQCHIITTTRSKVETAQLEENNKTVIKKVGVKKIQREDFVFDFMLTLEMDQITHEAVSEKDNTQLFDGKEPFVITPRTGQLLKDWANEGEPVKKIQYATDAQVDMIKNIVEQLSINVDNILDHYQAPTLKRLTKEQAAEIIQKKMRKVNSILSN